jgi:hypothetical protein
MENIISFTEKLKELEERIMIEQNIILKKEMIAKLLSCTKSLNKEVNKYYEKNQEDIYKSCSHVFEDYCEKYERTRQKCIHCDMIQY